MSSYAEAAASSGPRGAEKIPPPRQVNQTTVPQGHVESVKPEELEKARQKGEDLANEAAKELKANAKEVKKELDKLGKEGKSFLGKLVDSAKLHYNSFVGHVQASGQLETAVSVKRELQNPVVIAQALFGVGGIIAGYFTYLERHRINTDNRVVVATHAAIITGIVLVDGFLFRKYYPQYKK